MPHKAAILDCPKCRANGLAFWMVEETTHRHEVLRLPDGFVSAEGAGRDDTHYFVCAGCLTIANKTIADPAKCRERAVDARRAAQAAKTPADAAGWTEVARYWEEIAAAYDEIIRAHGK